jgi:cytochrome c-type biogenesis protein CcmH/NrfG
MISAVYETLFLYEAERKGEEKMKKILISVMVLFLAAACQQKQEQKSAEQAPSGDLQMQQEIKLLQEASAKDPGNGAVWIKLGNMLMDTSRFKEAADAYQKALEIDPKNVDVRVDMAVCYRNSGNTDISVKELRKAIEINPSHVNAHKNLAIILAYNLNDSAGAVKEFEKTLQLAPNAPDAERIKAEIQRLQTAKK